MRSSLRSSASSITGSMSVAAEMPPQLPELERLERVADDATAALEFWHRRATEAEAEMLKLRRALEDFASGVAGPDRPSDELRRLRAENTALRSRMQQARRRVNALLMRLGTLEARR